MQIMAIGAMDNEDLATWFRARLVPFGLPPRDNSIGLNVHTPPRL